MVMISVRYYHYIFLTLSRVVVNSPELDFQLLVPYLNKKKNHVSFLLLEKKQNNKTQQQTTT